MTSTRDPDNPFVSWLQDQIAQRDWTPQVLAARAGVAAATLSNVFNRKRSAGPEVLRGVARAFEMSQIEVFRLAGMIDEELLDDDKAAKEYLRLLAAIEDDDERQQVIDTVETILKRVASRRKADRAKAQVRPAVIKRQG